MLNDHSYTLTVVYDAAKKQWKARPRSNNPGPTVYAATREKALNAVYAAVLRVMASKLEAGTVRADDLTVTLKTETSWRPSSSSSSR